MDQKKISIIIPVYNAAKYLEKCVKSIINQTYKNLEIILIDDGSTDESGNICRILSDKDDRIKVMHQKNSGVSVARNLGLSNATGEYITFVDSDDYIESNYCEVLLDSLIRNNVDVAYSNDFNKFCERDININEELIWKSEEYDPVYKTPQYVVWGALYKRKVIENIRFDEDLYVGEDAYFFAKVVKNSNKLVCVNKELYHYIYHTNSAYNSKFNSKKITEIECWRRVATLFKDNKKIERRCKARLAIKSKIMLIRFINDSSFTKEYETEVFNEYYNNVKYLIFHMLCNHKYKKAFKEIIHFLFPTLWIKQISSKKKSNE